MNPPWQQALRALKTEPCLPPIFAKGGQAQTLLGHFLPSRGADVIGEDLVVRLPDGDGLACEHYPGEVDAVLYLFHGLAGSTESDYMRRAVRLGRNRGYWVVAANHRGCGVGRGLARGPYHSGRAEDLAEVIRWGRERHPHKGHIAIGFSLSGNALLLLQAGYRGTCQPDAGIAVNAPIDLAKTAYALARGVNRLYDLRFTLKCARSVKHRYRDGLLDRPYRFPPWITLTEFDGIYTAPAGGFENPQDYYRTCSAKPRLKDITSPTVLLTSRDDPMVDVADYLDAEVSPQVFTHIEDYGGHLGYLTRKVTPLGDHRWLDYALDAYVAALVGALRTQSPGAAVPSHPSKGVLRGRRAPSGR